MCRTRGNCGVFEGVHQEHIMTVTNFQSRGDYLTFNILTDREIQCDYSSCYDLISCFYNLIKVKFVRLMQWSHFCDSLKMYTVFFVTHLGFDADIFQR